MDDLDREILNVLRRDARTPYTEIAERVGTSEGTVRNRVDRMTDEGIIERFTVTTRTGNLRAMIEIEVAVDVDTSRLSTAIADRDDVDFVWQVGGESDIVVVVDAPDTRRLNDIISNAREMEVVHDTRTRLILEERLG
jgi:DNA-binding Lrp family transcriptional regulator